MERVTNPGRQIMEQSFAIIERELGAVDLPPWAFAVVRRMIHASADFDFAKTIRYHQGFEQAFATAIRERRPIVADVEMVRIGIQSEWNGRDSTSVLCFLNENETQALAEREGLTRTAAGIRIAARRVEQPIIVVGTAPTALDECLRLVEVNTFQPSAIIAMPVGFVGVEESKNGLLRQTTTPYLTSIGRKGGSAVTVAAVNALLECSKDSTLFSPNL